MAGVDGQHGVNTSPNSSEELDSTHATPSTKVSNLSPNDIKTTLKASTPGIVRSKVPPAFILTQSPQRHNQNSGLQQSSTYTSQDPFISAPILSATTQCSTDVSKLSPIASSFTPQSALTSNSVSSVPLSAQLTENLSKLVGFPAPTGLPPSPGVQHSTEYKSNNPFEAFSTAVPANFDQFAGPSTANNFHRGTFSTDNGTSRCLVVGKVANDCSAAAIEAFFSPTAFGSVKMVVFTDLVMASTVYVQFGDMRDVMKAAELIEHSPWGWSVQFLHPTIFAAKAQSRGSVSSPVSKYEAQVIVTVKIFPMQQFSREKLEVSDLINQTLRRSGDVMALEELQSAHPDQKLYRAEFYSSDAVDRLLVNNSWLEVEYFVLNFHRHEPDLQNIARASRVGPLIIGEDDIGLENAIKEMSLSSDHTPTEREVQFSTPYPSFLEQSPTSRSLTCRKDLGGHHTPSPLAQTFDSFNQSDSQRSPFWSPTYSTGNSYRIPSSIWSPESPGAIGQERGAMLSPRFSNFYPKPLGNGAFEIPQHQRSLYKGGRRHNEHSIGTHNVVDIHRIRIGLDVRTTIMLRNVPNKMTSTVLKGILDETSFGKYDFTYLRIDFANNCNVGYAFINFEDPIHIVNFVNARAGRRWNCYNSDKVAEISYASRSSEKSFNSQNEGTKQSSAIQGRDCLIQKFRNSSVMLEQPSSRPKIWSTSGPSVGQEENFPGPDNPSKMRRSVENAEHVGLFAPRAGQNFRDEQRRRRSQYDRGTRLAEIEESFESTYQYRGDLNPVAARTPSAANCFQQPSQTYSARRVGSF